MRSRLIATSLLLFATLAAHADTLQTLYVYATFQNADAVSGTLTYDLDLHFIVGGNVTLTGLYNLTWTMAGSTPDSHGTSSITAYNGDPDVKFDIEYVGFGLPVPFQPITICSLTNPCRNFSTDVFGGYDYSQIANYSPTELASDIAISGYITPVAPTPEPSGIALLGTGVLSLAVLMRNWLTYPATSRNPAPSSCSGVTASLRSTPR